MKRLSRCWVFLLTFGFFDIGGASAASSPVRFWILPFENAAHDKELAYLSRVVPELLTLFVSRAGQYSVVEREQLDRILSEQALGREGFVASGRRHRVGRLLGATTMITGSFARVGGELHITAHITDIASGRVQASAQVAGGADRLAETIQKLCKDLTGGLRQSPPVPSATEVDAEPFESLHFLRGLSYFYAARYHQALAEFIQCGPDAEWGGLPGLWRANCYLAREQYAHAYLELIRLKRNGPGRADPTELDEKLQRCVAHLSPDQVQAYERVARAGKDK